MNLKKIKDSGNSARSGRKSDAKEYGQDFKPGKYGWDLDMGGYITIDVEETSVEIANYDEGKAEGQSSALNIPFTKAEWDKAVSDMGGPHGISEFETVETPTWSSLMNFLNEAWWGNGYCGNASNLHEWNYLEGTDPVENTKLAVAGASDLVNIYSPEEWLRY